MARGPGGAVRVHREPRRHEQKGVVVPCRRAGARAHRCSPVVVEEDEPDEAVPEGCSTEHERQRRGGAMEVKNGGGLSST
jgi:hypothetical protein